MTVFDIHLIKPTRYDDDGYPVQWWRSIIPSNSLACLTGIVEDAIARGALPEGTVARTHVRDEVHTRIDVAGIVAQARRPGHRALVLLVGVQTNQFPRAMDIARPLRAAGIPVCIGGFHVSGCLAMLDALPPELAEAQALGISLFAGEAEDGRIDAVLRDGLEGRLASVYDHLKHTPNLAGAPLPLLPPGEVAHNINRYASFDLGRGCPFECSFCTIINVQGRKSRFRTPDDLERIVRENAANGVNRFFLTDDNFARNRNWEAFADRLIALRREGLKVTLAIQVDTLAHRIPNFIDKVHAAGADQIFIGMESINSDNLEAVKKRQNRIEDYRAMFLDWKRKPVVITCGFIVGFPNDTRESILRDIETIKTELPIDTLYLNYLTPLPGSENHKRALAAGVWMDPDLGRYDLNHRVTHHPLMRDADWEEAYVAAHRSFYSFAHMERVFRRMAALRSNKKFTTLHRLLAYREAVRLEGVAKLEAGYVRIRRRTQRRSDLPRMSPLVFYPWHWWRTGSALARAALTYARLRLILRRVLADPDRHAYVDAAIRPVGEGGADALVAASRVTPYARKRMDARTPLPETDAA